MSTWLTDTEQLLPELSRLRRQIHQHPEVGFQEFETSRFIQSYLSEHGIPYRMVGETGVVGELDSGRPGPIIALRADIDALELTEEGRQEYLSQNPGVMHACGHDAHTAVLMCTARYLKEHVDRFVGKVRFLFQPAEELPPGGAKGLIAAGVLDGVSAIFGLHVHSDYPAGQIAVIDGPMMAAADQFSIKITGKGGHAAYPHQTVDAVMVGCQVYNNLQMIVSRNVNPLQSAVLTVGSMHGGSRFNVIAETATLDGTVRTLLPETRQLVHDRMQEVVKGTAVAQQADCSLDYVFGYPATINHKEQADVIRTVGRSVLGTDGVQELSEPAMGAEDFSYYLEKIPGAFFYLGVRIEDGVTRSVHNPRFDLNEAGLVTGVRVMAGLAEHYLGTK